jgi:superkiller protein 3
LEPIVGTNPTKAEALAKTNSLAEGFVLLNVSSPGAEDGWSWIIEGKEESTICE